MADNPRHHQAPGDYDDMRTPRHLTKQEFARRLTAKILEMGWTQADLAHAAGIGRDAVSTYVRGRSLPTPLSLKKMADALGVEPHTLMPNGRENAIDNDTPSFEMRESVGHPGRVWVRVNRLLSFRQALAIAHVLDAEDADNGELLGRYSLNVAKRQEEQGELPIRGD